MRKFLLPLIIIYAFFLSSTNQVEYEESQIYQASSSIDNRNDEISSPVLQPYVPTITLNTKKGFPALFGQGADEILGGSGRMKFFVTSLSTSDVQNFVPANGNVEAHWTGSFLGAFNNTQCGQIIPRVSGNINGSDFSIRGVQGGVNQGRDNKSYHGHLAPEGGLAITNGHLNLEYLTNVVVRYLTVRKNQNVIPDRSDAIHLNSPQNMAFDHCSFGWEGDEAISIFPSQQNVVYKNIILQRLLVGQTYNSNNSSSKGALLGSGRTSPTITGETAANMHMSFFPAATHRTPSLGAHDSRSEGRFYNNVVYNWFGRTTVADGVGEKLDLAYNYYKHTDQQSIPFSNQMMNMPILAYDPSTDNADIFCAGNYVENLLTDLDASNEILWTRWEHTNATPLPSSAFRGTMLPVEQEVGYTPVSALEAKTSVVDNKEVGNNRATDQNGNPIKYHDAVDEGYFTAFNNGTPARVNANTWVHPQRPSNTPYADTDWNGIPDNFEVAHDIASSDEVITNWDFGGYSVVNNAGYTAFEIWSAFAAGDFELLDAVEVAGDQKYWLEAECADVGSNWSTVADDDASASQAVLPPVTNNYNSPPTNSSSIVSFDLDAEAGSYDIYARVKFSDPDDDSFYVRANGGTWINWIGIPLSNEFSWRQVHDSGNSNAYVALDLVNGANTIEFGHREGGITLDKIYVTNTSDTPTGQGDTDTDCAGVPVTGVSATPQNLSLEVGQTDSLSAAIAPNDATNRGVTWSSGDETVATVDSEGIVTAIAPGNIMITVTTEDGSFTDNIDVTVNPISDNIWLEAECGTVGSNWSTVSDSNASVGQAVLPPTSNNYGSPPSDAASIVSFDFNASLGAYSVYARVKFSDPDDDSFYVRANGGTWIRWIGVPLSNEFSWRQVHDSDNSNTLISFDLIDGANTIEFGHREGGITLDKVYVTNTSDVPSGQGNADPDCLSVPVTGVSASPENLSLEVGQTDGLSATVAPNDATNQVVTWSSGDDTIAMVDPVGTVTAIAPGTTLITVTTDDGSFTDTVNVSVNPVAENIWLEAECATVGSNWSTVNDSGASLGEAVLPPTSNNYSSPPTNPASIVSFSFDASAGAYSLHAKVKFSDPDDDSFYVRANGGTWIRWIGIPLSNDFSWRQVHDSDNSNTLVSFNLVDGANTIEFGHREGGISLDKAFITDSSNLPSGDGGADLNCGGGMNGNSLQARLPIADNGQTKEALSLFPNPTTNVVKVLGISGPKRISISDSSGKVIAAPRKFDDDEVNLDLSTYPPGSYYINVEGTKMTRTFKVIRQ